MDDDVGGGGYRRRVRGHRTEFSNTVKCNKVEITELSLQSCRKVYRRFEVISRFVLVGVPFQRDIDEFM